MLNHCQQLSIPHPDFLDDVEDHPGCCCKQKMGLNLQKSVIRAVVGATFDLKTSKRFKLQCCCPHNIFFKTRWHETGPIGNLSDFE